MKHAKWFSVLAGLITVVSSCWADEGHHHNLTPEEVGAVNFQNSCRPEQAADFNRAVALLHSFQYEQSRGAFEAIAQKDPNCAMAQWGVAMSHYHGLWKNGDLDAGRIAWQKASTLAAANKNTASRERAFIEALGEIYKTDSADGAAHALAYEHRLEALHAAYPEDSEATIFYALAIRVTAPDTDKTYAHQRRCGELLEPIFRQQPHHPGIAHYLIHCYDYPALAEKGLSAARAYAKIAPASAHAQHMPSHIFTRVGAWEDSIASNIHSKQSATEAEKTSVSGEARDQRLHAMDYLVYAYLQSGMDQKAEEILNEMNSLNSVSGLTATGNYAASAIPARYAIERQDWKSASRLEPDATAVAWAQALTWEAIGEGSARSGDITHAKEAEGQLASLRDKAFAMKNKYWGNQIEVQRLEVSAWILQAAGDAGSAIKPMRSAADLEETMDKDAVTPGAVTPGREMLAGLLLMNNQPAEALAAYEAVLRVAPNRFNALFGAATSAEKAGASEKARFYYRKLAEVAKSDERPQLRTVREKLVASRN